MVKAFAVATGELVRSYNAEKKLYSQPVVTLDRILVSSRTETFIFEKSTGNLLQTLPKEETSATRQAVFS